MSHEVETMAYANEVPWHGLGHQVSNDMTPEEMLVAAELDWTVSKRPLYYPSEPGSNILKRAHGQFAIVRDDPTSLLSCSGPSWKPIQNREAFEFFSDFVKAGQMTMETAGSLKGGQFVWALARMNNDFVIGKNDQFKNYLLLSTPHKVGNRFVCQYTPIRVVCWNTINMALGAGLKGNGTGYHQTHARAFDADAKKAAEVALGLATDQIKIFREAAETLSQVRLPDDKVRDYFFEVVQMEQVEVDEGEEPDTPKMIERFNQALLTGPGANLDTTKGTLFGALNAVTYVIDHQVGRNDDNRLTQAWMGSGSMIKRRALSLAMDYAKAV